MKKVYLVPLLALMTAVSLNTQIASAGTVTDVYSVYGKNLVDSKIVTKQWNKKTIELEEKQTKLNEKKAMNSAYKVVKLEYCKLVEGIDKVVKDTDKAIDQAYDNVMNSTQSKLDDILAAEVTYKTLMEQKNELITQRLIVNEKYNGILLKPITGEEVKEVKRLRNSVAILSEKLKKVQAAIEIGKIKIKLPVAYNKGVTSTFGYRPNPMGGPGTEFHNGIDVSAAKGTAILSAYKGKVEFAGYAGSYGNCVVVNHGAGLRTLYGHMSAIVVREGQEISQTQTIGAVGSTGRSTGNHLHFRVSINDVSVDPMKLIKK